MLKAVTLVDDWDALKVVMMAVLTVDLKVGMWECLMRACRLAED